MNYGFYLPPYQGRAGKFLDDCRLLREYSLNGPVASLEVSSFFFNQNALLNPIKF
jgi:hypothetical protein